jgi:hypothetical protein
MCDVQNEIVNIDGDELVLQGTAAKAVIVALELEKYNAKGNNGAMVGGDPALFAAIALQALVNTAPEWGPNVVMMVGAFIGVGSLIGMDRMMAADQVARRAATAAWEASPQGVAALAQQAAWRAAWDAADCVGEFCTKKKRGGAVNDNKCLVKFRNSSFQVSSVVGDDIRKLSSMDEDGAITYLSSLIKEFKSNMNRSKKGGRKTRRRRN